MLILNIFAILLSLSAVFAYINHRFIGLPTTIGVMLIALLCSVLVSIAGWLGMTGLEQQAAQLLAEIDFNIALMNGMLSFLLFAGALHVNLQELAKQKWVILSLATIGVCLSTVIVGMLTFYLLKSLGIEVGLLYCILFGALISPTDPVAVMSTVKRLGVSKELETTIAGESLFNDGVGVVIFLVLLALLQNPQAMDAGGIGLLFLEEAVGGIIFGLVLGLIGMYMLKTVDNYMVEILITLALVMGGYTLAMAIHTSGPIAIVVTGLLIGNHGRSMAMSDKTREHLDNFWELIDEILNIILFVLIGLEILILPINNLWLLAGVLVIPVVVGTRLFSVGMPIQVLRLKQNFAPNIVKILTWGGLRGGISVALALSLPAGEARDIFLVMTYVVVVFSIVVQGLTVGPLIRRLSR
ncbi:MAG: cation:proton antiporter [Arenicella sp.]